MLVFTKRMTPACRRIRTSSLSSSIGSLAHRVLHQVSGGRATEEGASHKPTVESKPATGVSVNRTLGRGRERRTLHFEVVLDAHRQTVQRANGLARLLQYVVQRSSFLESLIEHDLGDTIHLREIIGRRSRRVEGHRLPAVARALFACRTPSTPRRPSMLQSPSVRRCILPPTW